MGTLSSRVAIYPGSFDPPTNGHIDVIKRASKLVDKLIVGVGENSRKSGMFSTAERVALLEACCKPFANVEVGHFSGLAVSFAEQNNAGIVLRGIRSEADLHFELPMAHTNRELAPDIDVLFIPTSVDQSFISSSLVREIASTKGNLSPFVPEVVAKALKAKH